MEWNHTPDSSNIDAFKYDTTSKTLSVRFKGGAVYDYFEVPAGVFLDMVSAESTGKFLASQIKGKYEYALQGTSDSEE